MVVIHVKQDEERQFLYECESSKNLKEIARDLIEIHNLQSQIQHLVYILEQRLQAQGCLPDAPISLMRALSEAKTYVSKDQVQHRRPLSIYVLRDLLQIIEREALANQSLGFSDSNQLRNLTPGLELFQENTTQLLWAGKELLRSKRLCDYIGKNEKTKILLKLQPCS